MKQRISVLELKLDDVLHRCSEGNVASSSSSGGIQRIGAQELIPHPRKEDGREVKVKSFHLDLIVDPVRPSDCENVKADIKEMVVAPLVELAKEVAMKNMTDDLFTIPWSNVGRTLVNKYIGEYELSVKNCYAEINLAHCESHWWSQYLFSKRWNSRSCPKKRKQKEMSRFVSYTNTHVMMALNIANSASL